MELFLQTWEYIRKARKAITLTLKFRWRNFRKPVDMFRDSWKWLNCCQAKPYCSYTWQVLTIARTNFNVKEMIFQFKDGSLKTAKPTSDLNTSILKSLALSFLVLRCHKENEYAKCWRKKFAIQIKILPGRLE